MSIEILNISKSFENKKIIDNLTVRIDGGKAVGFWGVSGSGKTTLMNIILGVIKADSGEIVGTKGKTFSAVFQEDRLLPWLNVEKNIKYVQPDADIDRLLNLVELTECKGLMPDKLSGGMKRRVAIARALSKNADIYAFDEAVKGLDFTLKKHMLNVINDRIKDKTAIVITHDLEEAVMLCDKIYCFGTDKMNLLKQIDITENKSERNEETIKKYSAQIIG